MNCSSWNSLLKCWFGVAALLNRMNSQLNEINEIDDIDNPIGLAFYCFKKAFGISRFLLLDNDEMLKKDQDQRTDQYSILNMDLLIGFFENFYEPCVMAVECLQFHYDDITTIPDLIKMGEGEDKDTELIISH